MYRQKSNSKPVSEFVIEEVESIDADAQALLMPSLASDHTTFIPGKDLPLEETIANMSAILAGLGMKIEIASWRNIVPNVWSLHIRDAQSPMCFTNGKGSTKESALASALGEFIERLNCNFLLIMTSSGVRILPMPNLCIIQMKNGSARSEWRTTCRSFR